MASTSRRTIHHIGDEHPVESSSAGKRRVLTRVVVQGSASQQSAEDELLEEDEVQEYLEQMSDEHDTREQDLEDELDMLSDMDFSMDIS